MKDAVATMGTILTPDITGRDAVHVAVIATTAKKDLAPGQHVDKTGGESGELVGIVDPFLEQLVQKGERFWLYLYPRTITSLHHQWTHPAFDAPDATAIQASERWLRNFIEGADCPGYQTTINAAVGDHHKNEAGEGYKEGSRFVPEGEWQKGASFLHFNGRDAHGDIPPEFWDHVEIVTGKKIPKDRRANYFSCGC